MRRIITRFANFTHSIVSSGTLHLLNDSDTDQVEITVIPSNMATTISKVDTGDGVDWFKLSSGSSATGNFTLMVTAFLANPAVEKHAIIRISDNTNQADDCDVSITRGIDPA